MKADQLSKTAAFLAVKFYGLTRIKKFRSLFDEPVVRFYDRLVQTLPVPVRYYHFWLKFNWTRKLFISSEELLLPGDLLHVVGRKWMMQEMVVQLQKQGYDQLIVLGAGFDHLAFCCANKGLTALELDAPYMAKLKRKFLKDWYPKRRHPEIISAHFPHANIESLLSEHSGVDPNKKTIIVAEGFFDYLTVNTVSSAIRQIETYFSHKPALISTHFALDELSPFHRFVYKTSVRLAGEKLQFSTSMNDYERILYKEGYSISQLFDSQEIRKKLLRHLDTNLAILKGFYILLAK